MIRKEKLKNKKDSQNELENITYNENSTKKMFLVQFFFIFLTILFISSYLNIAGFLGIGIRGFVLYWVGHLGLIILIYIFIRSPLAFFVNKQKYLTLKNNLKLLFLFIISITTFR